MGGIAIGASAFLAACRKKKPLPQLPISGQNPGYKALTEQPVDDVVLLRTATSFEYTIIDAYQRVLDNKFVSDSAIADLLKVFSDHHAAHAAAMAEATKALGGTACTKLNPKVTSYLVEPLLVHISKSGANQGEDVKSLAFALETLAAETYQGVVPVLTQPALRAAAMSVGAVEAKHAAVLGAILNPTELVPASSKSGAAAGPTTTAAVTPAATANSIHAVPSVFGALAPVTLTVGPANENGVRPSVNLETPSLNSYMYADEAC
jgi:hypothetical protein